MSQRSYYVQPPAAKTDANPWILRLLLLGITAFFLIMFSMVALLAGYQFMVQDQVYPGLAPIYGVDISGMTRQEAVQALSARFTYADDARFIFQYGSQQWEVTAGELGVYFDAEATVDEAFAVGRDGAPLDNLATQWQVWREGHSVAPIIRYNQTQAQAKLNEIAASYINQPVLDASLTLQEGQVSTTPGQVGLQVDLNTTLASLQHEIQNLSTYSVIPLMVIETPPAIASAEAAAQEIRTALDASGVTFYIPDDAGISGGPWTAQPASIENMLRVERVENEDGTAYYDVYITLDQARDFLIELAPELSQEPVDARFIFNDSTRQLEVIQNSVTGHRLNVETTLAAFPDAVFSAEDRRVPLQFYTVEPEIPDTATAAELGITENVVEATTYFVGSSASRRANIQVAASRYHGIVIKPGETFSFNQWLGDVSAETGFEQALIIVGNQTITGVGGGVCQVTTTVFQAAFYGGYPIIERYPHGYRVGYYETGEGAGMDATVYEPIVDFRFLNDTPYHLLMESYVQPGSSQITIKFYSTDMGRRVVKEGPIIRNQEAPPPPIYRANPNFSPGQINQVDYAVGGAEVYVYRTVYQGDQVIIDREEFYSKYIPWAAQFEVAPGDPRINN